MRDEALQSANRARTWRGSFGAGLGELILGDGKGLDVGAAAARQQDLDFLLRAFKSRLAVTREFDPALESLERLIKRQITALQACDQGLKLSKRFFKVRWFNSRSQPISPPASLRE